MTPNNFYLEQEFITLRYYIYSYAFCLAFFFVTKFGLSIYFL